jgi:hypothetical protein
MEDSLPHLSLLKIDDLTKPSSLPMLSFSPSLEAGMELGLKFVLGTSGPNELDGICPPGGQEPFLPIAHKGLGPPPPSLQFGDSPAQHLSSLSYTTIFECFLQGPSKPSSTVLGRISPVEVDVCLEVGVSNPNHASRVSSYLNKP